MTNRISSRPPDYIVILKQCECTKPNGSPGISLRKLRIHVNLYSITQNYMESVFQKNNYSSETAKEFCRKIYRPTLEEERKSEFLDLKKHKEALS